jgi:hypothetical protein
MIMIRLLAMVIIFCGGALIERAAAAAYPVSGKWAYESSAAREDDCRKGPFMEFRGDRRFDTGGNVPDYRNKSISVAGQSRYRMVDEFFTGQIRGQASYELHRIDPDHLELRLNPRGTLIKLRRCD